jgi:hypothetical protein
MSELIIAMWLAAWLIQLCVVYLPIFRRIPRGHIIRRQKIISGVVTMVMTFVIVPFVLLPMLNPIYKIRFQKGFLNGLLGE